MKMPSIPSNGQRVYSSKTLPMILAPRESPLTGDHSVTKPSRAPARLGERVGELLAVHVGLPSPDIAGESNQDDSHAAWPANFSACQGLGEWLLQSEFGDHSCERVIFLVIFDARNHSEE